MQKPVKNPTPTHSPRTTFLKWGLALLLAAILVGAVAMAYWLPVQGYVVACEKSEQISCRLQRETFSDQTTWQLAFGKAAIAIVKVQPRRRGADRVFLYLSSGPQNVFAAEFEGDTALAQAEAAAAALNHVFSSSTPASARVEARPPAYLAWLTWGGIGLLGLFVLIIYRALCRPEPRSN